MRDIEGFEGLYAITSCGKVWSYSRKKFRVLVPDKDGYLRVTLKKDGKSYRFGVHRLVAQAYIPNPENKPTVNHKDECKDHNWIGNLEWATQAEQNNYGTRTKRTMKPVKCVETGAVYESIKAAAAAVNGLPTGISNCLSGKAQTHKGYHWERYYEED